MIEKLQAKKRILESALQDTYRDLGEAYAANPDSTQVAQCLNRARQALDKIRNVNIAIAEL